MPTNGAMETNMNRIASRLRTTEVERRAKIMRGTTPYIKRTDSGMGWRVTIGTQTKRFHVRNYGGSSSAALMAATEYRDSLLPADIREAMYRKLDAMAGRIDVEDDAGDGPRYRPTITSQWQLWHKPHNQQQQ